MSLRGVDGELLLQQVPAAVIAVDLERRVALWSPGAERLYGWTRDEALGRSVRELMLIDQEPLADEVSATTYAGAAWEGEMVVRHRDGSDLLVHVRNAPLRDASGALVGVIGASLDVAEARRIESARADELVRVSAQAAAAVERLERLQRLTAALVPAQDQAQVVATICANLMGAVGAAAAAVTLLDDDGVLRLSGSLGYTPEQVAGWATIPTEPSTPIMQALLTGQPQVFPDSSAFRAAAPGLTPPDAPFGARACVPISAEDRMIGVLALSFLGPHEFPESEQQLLVTIARMCGQALERSRLFAAERQARQRDAFLSSATATLTSSLDVETTLQHVASLLVPDLADYVVVHLTQDDGTARLAAAAHHDPQVTAWIRERARTTTLDLTSESGMAEVLRTGVPVHHPTVPQEVRDRLVRLAGKDAAAALLPASGVGVAMRSSGTVVGSLALVRTREVPFTTAEAALVQELADRAAIAVSHAQAFDRERTAALTLQQSLLPQELPALPGLTYAWRYLPGTAGVHVGGDWYDVVPLEHGRVAVLVGDVMGRGLRAAAVMGQLRATARAHMTSRSPSEVLRELDLAVTRLEQGFITTLLVGVLDPATGRVTYASAGHLPPLHARADGSTAYLEVDPGPPLGVGAGEWPESTARLSPGDTLLLYTDGLVEDRGRSVTDGMELLRASVTSPTDPHEAVASALAATGRDVGHDDDTAVLALTLATREQSAPHFLSAVVAGPSAARDARAAARVGLTGWDVPEWTVDDVLVVLTELVVNAVLHVGGEVEVALRRSDAGLRLEVRDGAPQVPPLPSLTSLTRVEGRPDDEALDAVITALDQGGTTGRGMTLVAGVADAWGWTSDPTGKTVWAVFGLDPAEATPATAPAPAQREVVAVLRGLPVRLVLASASHLDDLQREVSTSAHGPEVASLLARGLPLVLATLTLREPFRVAAREALARGARLLDVQVPVTSAAVEALRALHGLHDEVEQLARSGVLLTPMPDDEVAAFRRWWAEEVERQLRDEPGRDCPFPALPD